MDALQDAFYWTWKVIYASLSLEKRITNVVVLTDWKFVDPEYFAITHVVVQLWIAWWLDST